MDSNVCNREAQKTIDLKVLLLDSSFDSGNLARAELTSDLLVSLWIAPDCANTPFEKQYRTWFHFTATPNSQTNSKDYYRFSIQNMINQKHLFNNGMLPVYKTPSQEWQRLSTQVQFNLREGTDNEHNLIFSYRFLSLDSVSFAFTYPWSYQQDQDNLKRVQTILSARPDIYFHRELMAYSLTGLRVELVTISSRRDITAHTLPSIKGLFPQQKERAVTFSRKKYVFISARVHPGEIPASHVLRGMLEWVCLPGAE